MTNVLKALAGILTGDATLAADLGVRATASGTIPALYDGQAPEELPPEGYPYLIVEGRIATPGASHATERLIYVVDIYDGPAAYSAARTYRIADRIDRLLDGECPAIEGHTSLGIDRESRHRVIEEEPGYQHVHLEYLVRYGREDLYR